MAGHNDPRHALTVDGWVDAGTMAKGARYPIAAAVIEEPLMRMPAGNSGAFKTRTDGRLFLPRKAEDCLAGSRDLPLEGGLIRATPNTDRHEME